MLLSVCNAFKQLYLQTVDVLLHSVLSQSYTRGTQRWFPRKCIEDTFWANQSTFRCLEMQSKRR